MTRTPPAGTRREQIVELAARPDGVTNSDLKTILGMSEQAVPVNMQALEYQGRVLRAKAEGERLRWFKHVEHRDTWLAAMKAARSAVAAAEAAAKQAAKDARQAAGDKRRAEKAARVPRVVSAAPAAEVAQAAGRVAPSALPGSSYTAGASKMAPHIKGEPIITSDTIITEVPCRYLSARWQAQPSQPAPGFSTLGIGRYL